MRESRSAEGVRFMVVGVASNVALYIVYLLLTRRGVEHKLAMSLAYAIGVVSAFLLNKRWSFRHQGSISRSFVRYLSSYGIGYSFNLIALVLLVDMLGFGHEVVQGVLIIVVAAGMFLLQRYWVFAGD